jgi:hypothetical protein
MTKLSGWPKGLDKVDPARIADQVERMGLEELASYRTYADDGGDTWFVATDDGICVVRVRLPRDHRDHGAITATLTPWSQVAGVTLISAGFVTGRGGPSLTGKIKVPDFTDTVEGGRDQSDLVEFMKAAIAGQAR